MTQNEKSSTGKPGNFFSIFIPVATVFMSSFCVMVLEMAAGRLIAQHLGSSLYTWTAVIGVVSYWYHHRLLHRRAYCG